MQFFTCLLTTKPNQSIAQMTNQLNFAAWKMRSAINIRQDDARARERR